ncbi:MAG: hypothetical protein ACR2RE_27780 [Geminicoccaceae bacterium]
MSARPLHHTLTALIEGATPDHPAIAIEEAEIALPLIVTMSVGRDGPEFQAQPPWSAFRSGFEPVAHRARVRVEAEGLDMTGQDEPGASG